MAFKIFALCFNVFALVFNLYVFFDIRRGRK